MNKHTSQYSYLGMVDALFDSFVYFHLTAIKNRTSRKCVPFPRPHLFLHPLGQCPLILFLKTTGDYQGQGKGIYHYN